VAKKAVIPKEIQEEIMARVKVFNETKLTRKKSRKYYVQIKGKFIYLFFDTNMGVLDPVCRLTYRGDLNNMDFAIYKYSSEKYDPNEFCFPGSSSVNGKLEGAMRAGMKTY